MSTRQEFISENWLEQLISKAIVNRWCTKIFCTTCGATDFRKALQTSTNAQIGIGENTPLDTKSSQVISQALSKIERKDDIEWISAVRMVLDMTVTLSSAKSVSELLGQSWAGHELEKMTTHHQQTIRKKKEHEKRNDPEYIKKYREEKKALRQKEHEKRIEKKKERDRLRLKEDKIDDKEI